MLFYKKNVNDKERYFWNMLGGLFNSASSIILLSITTRISGASAGGIFSLAYSTAQMLETIGLTNVREIQSTDVQHEYDFSSYLGMRIITCILMIIIGIIYSISSGADSVKQWAIILLTAYKSIDALGDVFQGLFQLNNRIDLSGKELALRSMFSTVAFLISLLISDNLIIACFSMIIVSALWMLVFDFPIGNIFNKITCNFNLHIILEILLACLPLFLGNFMMSYVGNAPKYAINKYMDNVAQNTYGFLSMPAFVINMFSLFYFRPLLTNLAALWSEKKYHDFSKTCMKCILTILLLTIAAEIGSYLLGIPVLDIISGRNLGAYRKDLMIIMLGGSMTAMITLFHNIFACIRKQKLVLIPYAVGLFISLIISPLLVRSAGIAGACLAYTAANMTIAAIMVIIYIIIMRREKSE